MIETELSTKSNLIIARLPSPTTRPHLEDWFEALHLQIEQTGLSEGALLVDTGDHAFDSVQCMSLLRTFLETSPLVLNAINRVAFVHPKHVRKAETVSSKEAYFTDFSSALAAVQKVGFGVG